MRLVCMFFSVDVFRTGTTHSRRRELTLLSGGVLCLAWPARKSAQDGQSRPAEGDPAGPYGTSPTIWRAQDPRGFARRGAYGDPWPPSGAIMARAEGGCAA